jgi:hypothetical protein
MPNAVVWVLAGATCPRRRGRRHKARPPPQLAPIVQVRLCKSRAMRAINGAWERACGWTVVRYGTCSGDLESEAFRVYDNISGLADRKRYGPTALTADHAITSWTIDEDNAAA